METCYIVGAAPKAMQIEAQPGDYVIAADGGCNHLRRWRLQPNLIIGDMDSLGAQGLSAMFHCVPVWQVPKEKDETDTELALEEGLARGWRKFEFVGCCGGRPDHTQANLQLLVKAARRGAFACLRGEDYCATALAGGGELRLQGKGTVSVFAYGEVACGVTLRGLKYPLENDTLYGDVPRGVSNELDGEALITLEKGVLLIFWEHAITPLFNI
jgi:thiamine pyrophosphokinase